VPASIESTIASPDAFIRRPFAWRSAEPTGTGAPTDEKLDDDPPPPSAPSRNGAQGKGEGGQPDETQTTGHRSHHHEHRWHRREP
jgi:hypothetical protein